MTTAFFQDNTAQLVKDAADIVDVIGEQVSLRKTGINYKGLCPFHSEKTPSFTVNPEKGIFHCFGCGAGGDVFTFMMNFHQMTFPEALKELAGRYHIQLPEQKLSATDQARLRKKDRLYKANEKAADLYHDFLLHQPGARAAREYLEKRGIPPDIVTSFKLGYAPERWDFLLKALRGANISPETAADAGLVVEKKQGGHYDRFRDRIVCPTFDVSGRVIAFGGRILGSGEPKYLNSPETPVFNKSRTLYGLYQNKQKIRKENQIVLVEGNFDLLSLVAHNIGNVCAPLGTALTLHQVKILKRYASGVILLFDGDAAGLKAAMRAVPLFLTEQLDARVVLLPPDHDPDTFVRAFGEKQMEKEIAMARSLPEFVFERLVQEHGLTLEGKGKIVNELRPIIKSMGDRNLQRSLFVSHFSRKLGLQPEHLLKNDKQSVLSTASAGHKRKHSSPDLPLKQKQILEFLLYYPEFFEPFLDAGIEKVMDHDTCQVILNCMTDIVPAEGSAVVDLLLEHLSGRERSLISSLLVKTPAFSEEKKNEVAGEMIHWIKHHIFDLEKDDITRQINEAHQANDTVLLMELLEKKKEMDETSTT